MARPSPLSRPGPRMASGLGPPKASDVITFDGHEGLNVDEALDARPPTHVLASTDPTSSDDDTDGHVVGCRWINLATPEEFVAVDVSTGAAVWDSTTSGGGGSLTDHTHATTGSGSTGGGATLNPTTLTFPVSATPSQTTDAQVVWDSDDNIITVGDGAATKQFGYLGSSTPIVESGSGAAGSSKETSRADHVHPTSGGGGGVTVEDEGTPLTTSATTLNFTGAGVSASGAGATKTVNIPGASGAGTWTQVVNESGASSTGWNSHGGGTWSSNGTELVQTGTGSSWRKFRYGTTLEIGWPFIVEAECQQTAGAGSPQGIGINMTNVNGGTSGLSLWLNISGDQVTLDRDQAANLANVAMTLNISTWYKVRMVITGSLVSVWVDGVWKLNGVMQSQTGWNAEMNYLAVISYGSSALFRNIKAWTLSGGAPA